MNKKSFFNYPPDEKLGCIYRKLYESMKLMENRRRSNLVENIYKQRSK